MVRHIASGVAVATWCGLGLLTPAQAQSNSIVAPSVGLSDREYRPTGVKLGPVRVYPVITATAMYDSNVYAEPTNRNDDIVFIVRPQVAADYTVSNFKFDLLASMDIARYASLQSENSEAVDVVARTLWSPSAADRVVASAGYNRVVEDRGDPEARNIVFLGRRVTEVTFAGLQYRRDMQRWLFDAQAEARKFNALADIDAPRDFTNYTGRATVGTRIAGALFGTATGFVTRRDFRLGGSALVPERDSTTYGGRVGFETEQFGLFRGSASVGLFRFKPDSLPATPHTGFSAEASLTYLPSRRTAIVLDGFSGDVATFRQGAQSRIDSRLGLVVQQEVRHNLFGALGVRYRQTRFRGSDTTERTYIGTGEGEYLLNRTASLVGWGNVAKRTSDDPFDKFERFRVGITLRLRG